MSVEKKVATFLYPSVEQTEENYTLLMLWMLNVHSPVLGRFLYCLGTLAWTDLFDGFYKHFLLFIWLVSFLCIPRYGEKNNAFIVASFENEDENKDEISKKVSRALDKVTSDYHSGSSSSDEDTSKEVEVKPSAVATTPSPVYQVRPTTACHCMCKPQASVLWPASPASQLHCPWFGNIFSLSSSFPHTLVESCLSNIKLAFWVFLKSE